MVATGVPVHTSGGEVNTQLTSCSGGASAATYSVLSLVAHCIVSIPATSVPCERLFSVQHSWCHCLGLSLTPCAWCRSPALVAIVTISRDIVVDFVTISRSTKNPRFEPNTGVKFHPLQCVKGISGAGMPTAPTANCPVSNGAGVGWE